MSSFITSKINGNQVDADEWNQLADYNTLQSSSGQTPSSSNINQGSIAAARYASAGQYFLDSGTANAYVLSPVAPFKAPVDATVGYFVGMTIRFRAGNANSGASTVNVNSAGVKNLKKEDGTTDLDVGDIPTTQDSVFRYNGTVFVLESGSASTTAKGIVELLTNAELAAGTDSTRAATAAAIASLFSNSTLASPGVIYIPVLRNGIFEKLIVQLGNYTSTVPSGGSVDITLPVTFPTAFLSAICCPAPAAYSGDGNALGTTKVSTSVIRINNGSGGAAGNTGAAWLAIGY